jgi:hypothetical protein
MHKYTYSITLTLKFNCLNKGGQNMISSQVNKDPPH